MSKYQGVEQTQSPSQSLDQDIVQHLSELLVNDQKLMAAAGAYALHQMSSAGLMAPHELINGDHERYNEHAEDMYYQLQASRMRQYVLEALREF